MGSLLCCEHFCHLSSLLYPSNSFSHLLIPIRPTSCPTPIISATPSNSLLKVYHLPLNCHTCYFLSTTWCPASQMDMQFWVIACTVQNIKSVSPARRSFIDRICLSRSHHHPHYCSLHCSTHLVLSSIVFITAALQWQSGNYILQCVIPNPHLEADRCTHCIFPSKNLPRI